MSPYGSPWAFLFSILLSGKFLDTKVELCLQRALKERYKTLVLVINVGHPRRYIYSLRLTSWNKIEEGSNLQVCQVWRQRGRAEGTLSTSTIPTFIFAAGSLPTEGDSQKVIDSTPIGSTRIFSSEPLVSLIEKSCSSAIHHTIHHHMSTIVLGIFKICCSFKRLISWSNPWFFHFLTGQKTKALRLNIKYLFNPGPLFIRRMTCQNYFLKNKFSDKNRCNYL